MKKKFLSSIALLTMAVASCTENIVPTEVVKPETKLENRTIEDIIRIAQNAPSLFDGEDGTRGTTNASKEIDLSSITSITNKGMTRTSGAIDTLLYVMNYADNEGYVIVSSKQGTPGVSLTSDTDSRQTPANGVPLIHQIFTIPHYNTLSFIDR